MNTEKLRQIERWILDHPEYFEYEDWEAMDISGRPKFLTPQQMMIFLGIQKGPFCYELNEWGEFVTYPENENGCKYKYVGGPKHGDECHAPVENENRLCKFHDNPIFTDVWLNVDIYELLRCKEELDECKKELETMKGMRKNFPAIRAIPGGIDARERFERNKKMYNLVLFIIHF